MAASILIRALAVFSAAFVVLVTVSVLGFGVVVTFDAIWGDRLTDEYAINGLFVQGALFTGTAAFLHWVFGFVTVPIALIGGAALSYSFDSDAHGYRPDRLTKSSIVLVGASISLGGVVLLHLFEWVEISPWNLLGACIMGVCLGVGPAWLGTKIYLFIANKGKQSRAQ